MNTDNRDLDFWAIAEGRNLPPASARLLNWRFVRLDATGVLHCAFEPTEAFLNPAGLVQGGILAAMLDEAMSPVIAAVSRDNVFTQTLEMATCARPALAPSLVRDAYSIAGATLSFSRVRFSIYSKTTSQPRDKVLGFSSHRRGRWKEGTVLASPRSKSSP